MIVNLSLLHYQCSFFCIYWNALLVGLRCFVVVFCIHMQEFAHWS
jgi:hypothetical protein